jgi:hypothetical protein
MQRWLLALALTLAAAPPPAAARARGADGEFDERRSAHFVLLQDVAIDQRTGPRGSRRFEREVLAALEAGYDLLDDLLGLRPRRPIEVRIYDATVFDETFAGLFRFPAAGFYHGVIQVRSHDAVSPALVSTLHHELVHAALAAEAPSALLPAWFNEGLAEWFEARASGRRELGPRGRAALASLAERDALASIDELSRPSLARFDPEQAAVAYLQSYALVDHLVQLRGERVLRDLLARLARSGDLARALERASGLDPPALQRSLIASLAGRA